MKHAIKFFHHGYTAFSCGGWISSQGVDFTYGTWFALQGLALVDATIIIAYVSGSGTSISITRKTVVDGQNVLCKVDTVTFMVVSCSC